MICLGTLGLTASAAGAVTVNFYTIPTSGGTPGNSVNNVASQLTVDVTDGGTGGLFNFLVSTGLNSGANVTEIYFSDLLGIFTAPLTVVSQAGALFTTGSANPGNVPGANNATPPFVLTAGLLADATGRSTNGLTIGDSLLMGLSYSAGKSFSDVMAALTNGNLRVAMHVRSLTGGASDSVVSLPTTPVSNVPLPAAGLLLASALFGAAALRARRST